MKSKFIYALLVFLGLIVAAYFTHTYKSNKDAFEVAANELLVDYAKENQASEYFSGASLSISIPGEDIRNFYYGKVAHDDGAKPVTKETLFQIGSITKSFTSAILLQLEAEGKINLKDELGKYLPQYPKWRNQKIVNLLNMTSCLPNYTNDPEFNVALFNNTNRIWTEEQLIDLAYPKSNFTPTLRKGFYYSNTDYILVGKIIETLTGKDASHAFNEMVFKPANLANTYYSSSQFEPAILSRIAHGYSYDSYIYPSQLGKDMTGNNLTWAATAGGVIASTADIIKWVHAIFIENKVLNEAQKNKLMTLVSSNTGKAINDVSKSDADGYGLGVSKSYNPLYPAESMWSYEGQTHGFRAIYFYTPCNKVIIAAAFNSGTYDENDHASKLLNAVYDLVIKDYPKLRC